MDMNNIDNSDRDLSSDPPSPSSSNGNVRDLPNCGKCRNHGVIVQLRGHKRDCPFKDCACACCILGFQRRDVMARQNSLLKKQKQQQQQQQQQQVEHPADVVNGREMAAPVDVVPPLAHNGLNLDLEEHTYAANELIKIFELDMNALPFAYAVLAVAGDLRTACHLINEARQNLSSRRPSRDELPRAGPSAFMSFRHGGSDEVNGGSSGDVGYCFRTHQARQRHQNGVATALPLIKRRHDLPDGDVRGGFSKYRHYSRDSSQSPPRF